MRWAGRQGWFRYEPVVRPSVAPQQSARLVTDEHAAPVASLPGGIILVSPVNQASQPGAQRSEEPQHSARGARTTRVRLPRYLLLTTYYLLLTTHYSLLTTYYLLLTTYYSLLTTYYLLLTTYYLLLTTYYWLLTTDFVRDAACVAFSRGGQEAMAALSCCAAQAAVAQESPVVSSEW